MACVSVCECIKCNSVITLAFQIHIVIVILINDNTQQSANESVLFSKIISIFFFTFFRSLKTLSDQKNGRSRRIARAFIVGYDF